MIKAKIEIHSKHIVNGWNHLYILFTDSKGIKYAIAAGPKDRSGAGKVLISMSIHDLKVVYDLPYIKGHPDWDDYSKHLSTVIFEGTDAEVEAIVWKMIEIADRINAGNYDYKLPILLKIAKIIGINTKDGGIAHCHNSNTVVRELVEEAGLKMVLPKDKYGNDVVVPCMDAKLMDTILDKVMKGDDLTPGEIEELEFAFAVSAGTALGGWSTLVAERSAVNKVRSYYKAKKAYEEDAKKGGDEAKKDDSKNGVGRGEDDKNGGNDDNDNSNNDGDDGFGGGFIGGIGSANDGKARIRADDAAEVAVLAEMHEVVTAAIREAIAEVRQLEVELAETILAGADVKVIADAKVKVSAEAAAGAEVEAKVAAETEARAKAKVGASASTEFGAKASVKSGADTTKVGVEAGAKVKVGVEAKARIRAGAETKVGMDHANMYTGQYIYDKYANDNKHVSGSDSRINDISDDISDDIIDAIDAHVGSAAHTTAHTADVASMVAQARAIVGGEERFAAALVEYAQLKTLEARAAYVLEAQLADCVALAPPLKSAQEATGLSFDAMQQQQLATSAAQQLKKAA